MLWIRIGFSADPYPAFYLNAYPDPDPGSRTSADPDPDPDPDQTWKSQKLNFYLKNIPLVLTGHRSKNVPTKVQKPF